MLSFLRTAVIRQQVPAPLVYLQAPTCSHRRTLELHPDISVGAATEEGVISPGATAGAADAQALVPALPDTTAEVSRPIPEVAIDPGRAELPGPGPQLAIERQRGQEVRVASSFHVLPA